MLESKWNVEYASDIVDVLALDGASEDQFENGLPSSCCWFAPVVLCDCVAARGRDIAAAGIVVDAVEVVATGVVGLSHSLFEASSGLTTLSECLLLNGSVVRLDNWVGTSVGEWGIGSLPWPFPSPSASSSNGERAFPNPLVIIEGGISSSFVGEAFCAF